MIKPRTSSTAFGLAARSNMRSVASQGLKRASGFTLIELMVALTLGLLIVAAGLSVFLSSQRSLGLQSGMSELQQNANFGLSLLTYDLRHANLNTDSSQRVNSFTVGSGIVFTQNNLPTALHTITDLETEFVTLSEKDDDNTTGMSDRLTIQYKPATDSIFNCEGGEINSASSRVIVQRYYVAESPNQDASEPTAYSLYCDAGYYEEGGTVITGLDHNAQQIMQRIEAFKVRFGVKNPAGQLRYMTLDDYKTAMDDIYADHEDESEDDRSKQYLNVVSIEIGLLARSTGKIGSEASLNTQATFNLAGTSVTLDGDNAVNRRYLRQAVNQVVAIRNTLGAS